MSDKINVRQCVFVTVAARLAMSCFHYYSGSVRGDSIKYHLDGLHLAEQYLNGQIPWGEWIDGAWFQFVALLYAFVYPSLFTIFIVNALFAGIACALLYYVSNAVSGSAAVAKITGLGFALFPSAVFFHGLPLKECAAVMAVLMLIWGTMLARSQHLRRGLAYLIGALCIFAGLRVYLVPVGFVCACGCMFPFKVRGGLTDLLAPAAVGACVIGGVLFSIQGLEINLSDYAMLEYFDLERLNYTRTVLSRGQARMFDDGSQAAFGQGVLSDLWLAGVGVYYFLLGVDPTNLRSERQYMALIEMALVIFCLPSLATGVIRAWKRSPAMTLPPLLITCAIVAVYGAGTTNAGAMYRWRLQAIPCLIMFAVYGGFLRKNFLIYPIINSMHQKIVKFQRRRQAGITQQELHQTS